MANPKTEIARPITFELDSELLKEMSDLTKKGLANSISELVRLALVDFNFNDYYRDNPSQCQISVRIPTEVRQRLYIFSEKKKVSVGELLRVAIKALCSTPLEHQTKKTMALKKTAKKKVVKKAAKKVVKKKAAKKATGTATKKTAAKRKTATKKK